MWTALLHPKANTTVVNMEYDGRVSVPCLEASPVPVAPSVPASKLVATATSWAAYRRT